MAAGRSRFINKHQRKSIGRENGTAPAPRTIARAETRPVRGGGKHVRLWSPQRPERPEVDPIYLEVLQLLERDQRSVWTKANESGLSTTTIYNWQRHKTKRPSGVSLQMAARLLGRRIVLE